LAILAPGQGIFSKSITFSWHQPHFILFIWKIIGLTCSMCGIKVAESSQLRRTNVSNMNYHRISKNIPIVDIQFCKQFLILFLYESYFKKEDMLLYMQFA
jgi:hypothetical protein